MPLSLCIRNEAGQERRLDFEKNRLTVGSAPHCDITITDDGVDDEQTVLVARGDRVEFFDIGVTRGLRLNGDLVGHGVMEAADELRIGATVITLATDTTGVSIVQGRESNVTASVGASGTATIGRAPSGRASPEEQYGLLLKQVGELLQAVAQEADVFESILDRVFQSAQVRRGFIALLDDEGRIQVKAHRNEEFAKTREIEVSSTLLGMVMRSGEAVLTTDAETDPELSASMSIQRLQIRSAICVPLAVRGKVIGVLYGDNRERPGSLTRDDLTFLNALGNVAAVAVEQYRLIGERDAKRKIEQSLSIARSIQRNFLPSQPPVRAGLDLHGVSESCDETGGDYYDFLELPDGRMAVVVADVTGHGIGPALLMASMRAALRALIGTGLAHEDLLPRMNRLLCDDIRDGRFVTLSMAICDADAGRVLHIGAGHPPILHYRAATKKTHALRSFGPPLGVFPDVEFPADDPVDFESGDVLLMTTDGIAESPDKSGEQFGEERVEALLEANAGKSAQEIVEAVVTACNEWVDGEPMRDDATLVAIKRR
ncbi:MAG: SpoIIE family protein phosphatase [Planctomycetota bacterium]